VVILGLDSRFLLISELTSLIDFFLEIQICHIRSITGTNVLSNILIHGKLANNLCLAMAMLADNGNCKGVFGALLIHLI